MKQPEPPEKVRMIHTATGETIPIEVVYEGLEGDIHMWAAVSQVEFDPAVHRISIDKLPGKTGVRVRYKHD